MVDTIPRRQTLAWLMPPVVQERMARSIMVFDTDDSTYVAAAHPTSSHAIFASRNARHNDMIEVACYQREDGWTTALYRWTPSKPGHKELAERS